MTHRMRQDAQAAGGRHWWTSAEQRSEQKQQAQSMDEVTRLNSKSPKIHWQDAPKVWFMFSNSEGPTHQVFDGIFYAHVWNRGMGGKNWRLAQVKDGG